jgi:hypothetical protein
MATGRLIDTSARRPHATLPHMRRSFDAATAAATMIGARHEQMRIFEGGPEARTSTMQPKRPERSRPRLAFPGAWEAVCDGRTGSRDSGL